MDRGTHQTDDLVVEIQGWATALGEVKQRLASYFARSAARQWAMAYLHGSLSPIDCKNSWQLAESVGHTTPYGFQHLLGRADWDADAVGAELRQYVMAHLGDPEAIVGLDETGFLKKGRMSAGVARQRSFQTKPALARQMLARLIDAQVPFRWVTADSIYGDDRRLRRWLEERDQAYVLAVLGKDYVWIGWRQHRVNTLLAHLPDTGWERLSAGAGAKGPRFDDWFRFPIGERFKRLVVVGCSCGAVSLSQPM